MTGQSQLGLRNVCWTEKGCRPVKSRDVREAIQGCRMRMWHHSLTGCSAVDAPGTARLSLNRAARQSTTVAMCLAPSQIILSMDEAGAIAPPIFTSVGQDAVNGAGDVFVIQSLLNKRLPTPHTEVPVTGIMDIGTVLAIKAFQAVVMNMNPATGYVAPGSPTYYALAARPLVAREQAPPAKYGHVGIVPPDVLEAARTSRQRWGIPASITLAQWIVESAWGAAMPPASNNPFGIKGPGLPTRRRKRDARGHRRQGRDHYGALPAL